MVIAAFSGAIGLNNEQRVAIKAGLFVLVALQNRNPHDFLIFSKQIFFLRQETILTLKTQ